MHQSKNRFNFWILLEQQLRQLYADFTSSVDPPNLLLMTKLLSFFFSGFALSPLLFLNKSIMPIMLFISCFVELILSYSRNEGYQTWLRVFICYTIQVYKYY
ncbi:hypothetical protein BDF21DRAFT_418202 [Thamnidium elegans]|nr:hypothetical protein BDF21DRAFT_418202 [Thamnidium elegans]